MIIYNIKDKLENIFLKGAKIYISENPIINNNRDENISLKCKLLLGCDKYDMNPPLCCRLLKRLGICYMINRYFKRKIKTRYN